jgi:hypothetical protein
MVLVTFSQTADDAFWMAIKDVQLDDGRRAQGRDPPGGVARHPLPLAVSTSERRDPPSAARVPSSKLRGRGSADAA